MGVEAIVRVVEAESIAEAEAIVGAARDDAAARIAAAEAAAEARIREAVERAEPGFRAEARRRVNVARVGLLERQAARTADLVDEAAREAARRLHAIAADPHDRRWRAAVARLTDETAVLIGPGGTVLVRAVDGTAAAPAAAAAGCRLELLPDDAAAGVIGRSADGRIEVDATLATRLARARTQLAGRVVDLLPAT